jgi:hypothetical protein
LDLNVPCVALALQILISGHAWEMFAVASGIIFRYRKPLKKSMKSGITTQ